jgi:Xaa-Pro aminopeptidase
MLAFETLTFAPIDRTLIRVDMLSPQERAWVDAYHTQVLDRIAPQLEGEARSWLEEQCRPLG